MPRATTPTTPGLVLPLLGLLLVLLTGSVLLAPAARAIEDPTRPDARIVRGPSYHPGGVEVEVTATTVAYAVTLATTRNPQGEDSAEIAPGETVVLRTGGVAWGETIDSRLEYTALDGSGMSFVDELEGWTFTRPAEEDCAAIREGTAGVPGHDVGAPGGGVAVAPAEDEAALDADLQTTADSRTLTAAEGWSLGAAALALGGVASLLVVTRRGRTGTRWTGPPPGGGA